jgi:FkbM family methyltransferase
MYEILRVTGERRRRFSLVLPQDKGRHAAELAAIVASYNNYYHQGPHLGVFLLDFLRGGGTLIDVGANIGLGAIPAAVYGSNVVAVELLPENCFLLTLAALENRLENIRIFQMAAGEERRIAGLTGSEIWGRVVSWHEGAAAMMLPLDDIVDLANLQGGSSRRRFVRRPVLLKIDAEGYELPVLEGARGLIERFDPTLVAECTMIEGSEDDPTSYAGRALKEQLEAQSYSLYLHRGDRLVPHKPDDIQEGHVCDLVASHKHYREGDRIGRFRVARLEPAESIRWVSEMLEPPSPSYRLHATGVVARWRREGHNSAVLHDLEQRLLKDSDPEVAANAQRLLGPIG